MVSSINRDSSPIAKKNIHHCNMTIATGPMYWTGALTIVAVEVNFAPFLDQWPEHMCVTIECQPVCRGVAIFIPLVQRIVQSILIYKLLNLAKWAKSSFILV